MPVDVRARAQAILMEPVSDGQGSLDIGMEMVPAILIKDGAKCGQPLPAVDTRSIAAVPALLSEPMSRPQSLKHRKSGDAEL
jgi:hypothetical protein